MSDLPESLKRGIRMTKRLEDRMNEYHIKEGKTVADDSYLAWKEGFRAAIAELEPVLRDAMKVIKKHKTMSLSHYVDCKYYDDETLKKLNKEKGTPNER